MKTFTLAGVLAFASCYRVLATSSASTVECQACKPAPSTPDIVTRSPVPVTSCTEPALTTVAATTGGSNMPSMMPGGNSTSTMMPPVAAAGNLRAASGVGLAAVIIAGAICM